MNFTAEELDQAERECRDARRERARTAWDYSLLAESELLIAQGRLRLANARLKLLRRSAP